MTYAEARRGPHALCTKGLFTLALALTGLLSAGCGTAPPTRFHTLLPPPSASASPVIPVAPAPSWELLPVTVPVQVDQPQLVVRLADDTLAVLEDDRWIAPLADEIRAALVQRIAQAFAAAALPTGKPNTWRITIEVRRFDSAVGRYARLEADWTLGSSAGDSAALRCRGAFEQAVGAGVPALAAGHRAAVAQLGDALAATIKAAVGGAGAGCTATAAS